MSRAAGLFAVLSVLAPWSLYYVAALNPGSVSWGIAVSWQLLLIWYAPPLAGVSYFTQWSAFDAGMSLLSFVLVISGGSMMLSSRRSRAGAAIVILGSLSYFAVILHDLILYHELWFPIAPLMALGAAISGLRSGPPDVRGAQEASREADARAAGAAREAQKASRLWSDNPGGVRGA
jgi:hypothetical protein